MSIQQQSKSQTLKNYSIPQRSRFQFTEAHEPNIFFNSKFDSGNMNRVIKTTYDQYSIWTACDAEGTQNEGYPKSWFYFQVGGFCNRKITFILHRIHFLYAMIKRQSQYRPVYRINYQNGEISNWGRLAYPVLNLDLNYEEELELKFDFMFSKLMKSVEFAFIYPYSYEQCRSDLEKLRMQNENSKDLFFQQCELTRSYEGRIIDFLIISSQEGRQGWEITKGLPFSEQKIARFRSNKPIIFISARVHPIETPSSFTINGVIQFLLDKKDMRAYLLRKYFVFVLVPMLNPDGVSRGHCRMDALNQNLNRYYTSPDPQKQPSCYAIKKLCEHYDKDKRLFLYLDLHAHPAFKGNFTFGNAIYQFVQQVESQLFPKLLSQNCISFQFQQCVFSRKHMKAKDRNEEISKQGCGRVVFYKQFGLVHSYTLECGYHLNSFNNSISPESNTNIKYLVKYKLNQFGHKVYSPTEIACNQQELKQLQIELSMQDIQGYEVFECTTNYLDNIEDNYYKRELPLYMPDTFYNLGRNILISILDIWSRNPYSRVSDLNAHRRDIAEKQSKLDRFRKQQAGIKAKQKKIVQLIEEQFYAEWNRRNIFNCMSTTAKDRKRNQTLQSSKVSALIRHPKSQKVQKIQVKGDCILPKSQTFIDTDLDSLTKNIGVTMLKRQQSNTSDCILENKGFYSRHLKLNRSKQMTTAKQQNKSRSHRVSNIKKVIFNEMKMGLEEQFIIKPKKQGLSITTKLIQNISFGATNIKIRKELSNNSNTVKQ